ncbi:TetR/AcrR family transcriptional regulator [Brachybacterium sp. ACRRE]|uniref:TetR/AcrR family transcriptional regulator n=1 Tax=Brachybacterium sp. ACRRE TaxID=2918184 RepID=UPI001EF1A2AC|nr:TetR/AcrR family transcriptional regulator [Brachybacterium sp. ACRRE]
MNARMHAAEAATTLPTVPPAGGSPSAASPSTDSPSASAESDGRTARWARHREQRRADLLDVARHLIHERGPDVTMEEIASASGTSKSIIYRYFSDKAHLQRALGLHILSAMQKRLTEEVRELASSAASAGERGVSPEDHLRAMISTYVDTAQRSPHVYAFVTRPSDGLNHFLDSATRLAAAALPAGHPAPGIWAAGAVGFVERAVDRWMRGEDDSRPSADDLSDHLVTWLMKGMR